MTENVMNEVVENVVEAGVETASEAVVKKGGKAGLWIAGTIAFVGVGALLYKACRKLIKNKVTKKKACGCEGECNCDNTEA